MEVYRNPIVQGVIDYYGDALFSYQPDKIINRLTKLSKLLWKAYTDDNVVVLNEINNYHPDYIGKSWKEIRNLKFSEEDAFDTLANQYGYKKFKLIDDQEIDLNFENAVDMLLAGNISKLEKLISGHPEIVKRVSKYAHRATLLHYVGNNGVELYRQVLPANLADCMELLVRRGADVNATMNVYGGQFKMIDLLNTSIHPKDSGTANELINRYDQLTQFL